MTFSYKFLDSGREPQCAPNPAYPEGMFLDLSDGKRGCCFSVPYPAPRCGMIVATCDVCCYRAAFSVAGRPDDPRSVKLPCRTN